MRKIIKGKVYDTETAELVFEWHNRQLPGDFKRREKDLYRTKKGNWFIHHTGGPMTDMAKSVDDSSYTGSESIEPVSEKNVIGFLESHGGDVELEEFFPDYVEEA